MSAPELRAAIRVVLDRLDDGVKDSSIDALLARGVGAAWRAAPTLMRLLGWLVADGYEWEPIRAKAAKALARCPKTAARQIGLLRVLVGDVNGAGKLLAKSPGLGWSNPDHPGHLLFPLAGRVVVEPANRRRTRDRSRSDGPRSPWSPSR